MIIELNTKLLDIPGLTSSQLIFLSLVLDKNQKTYNQDVLVSEALSPERPQRTRLHAAPPSGRPSIFPQNGGADS